ncbi:MAG: Cof-type HAD-IIB family hydrolase [Firmicutes bacterium]|nr:Cof-type HAD-IIB family hydrolase [Bacillota bacterium]
MPQTHLIAVDLDGTLLADRRSILPRTAGALTAARRQGHRVVIATGRPPRSALRSHNALMLDGPIVTMNGAYVFFPTDKTALAECPIPRHIAERVVERARKFKLTSLLLELGQTLHFAHCDSSLDCASASRWIPFELQDDSGLHELVCDIAAPLPDAAPLAMLMCVAREDHEELTDALLRECGHAVGVRSWREPHEVLEITPVGVTKATALAHVAAYYGIDRQHVIAFGDEMNDREMLAWAGTGVAMGDGNPEVKACADVITAPSTEDGIAAFLESHLLVNSLFTTL